MRVLMRSVAANLLLVSTVSAQTYEPVLLPPQVQGGPATATPLPLGDDNTAKVDLGFEFNYWGQTFTSAWVSSNGFVSFQGGDHLCCNGAPLENAQRNTIYGFWTDLISWSNPYYTRSEGSILFGWYDTQEYGTQNRYTFEIGLKDDNSIQFNYGSMPNLAYHYATAGITGPEAGDNIQLFYGRNANLLSFQSGALTLPVKQTVDCAVTPLDPSCPPQVVAQTQTITAPIVETMQEAYAEDVQADRAEELAASEPEPEQEIAIVETQAETTSVTAQVAESVAAERLTPDQVLALAAPTYDGLSLGAGGFVSFSTLNALSSGSPTSSSSVFSQVESVTSTSSPSSVANTLEALNMASTPAPMATTQTEQTANSIGAGQAETMEAIAAVPGFSAYTQVALQDRPDFYAPRDIYKNRRLRDANFEMYVITNSNTRKWQEMVDAQYER